MHVQLTGLFVCLESKEWATFEDSNNNTVNGGQSHKVYFYDQVGNVLYMAKILGGSNGIALDTKALEVARTLGFGTEVAVTATGKARNNVIAYTLQGIAPARKAA